jgi:hypothetical protein
MIPARGLALALAASTLSSCAVLTIDVDVYKGPLINSERMKVEQIVAMSVAARPLLLHLRSMFEHECAEHRDKHGRDTQYSKEKSSGQLAGDCLVNRETPKKEWVPPTSCPDLDSSVNAVNEGCLGSWQARRVNAILSLYQDENDASECLKDFPLRVRALRSALDELRVKIYQEGKALGLPATTPYSQLQFEMVRKRRHEASKLMNDLLDRVDERARGVRPGERVLKDAEEFRQTRQEFVKLFLSDPDGTLVLTHVRGESMASWQKALRALMDPASLNVTCSEPKRAMVWLADFVASLTDPFELTDFLGRSEANKIAPTWVAQRSVAPALRAVPDMMPGQRNHAFAEIKAALLSARGRMLAAELLAIQDHLRSRQSSAIPAGLATQHAPADLEEQAKALAERLAELQTGLAGGRRGKGILSLTTSYMELNTLSDQKIAEYSRRDLTKRKAVEQLKDEIENTRDGQRAVKRKVHRELLDSLTDLAQKVAHMANLQPLLPNNKDAKGKRIQLLQAIGNSILNQIDDLKKHDSYKDRIENDRQIAAEIAGIRNARSSMSGAVLAELSRDVAKAEKEMPRKEAIMAALGQGDAKVREALKLIQDNLAEAKKSATDEKENQENWRLGKSALGDAALPGQIKKALTGAKTDTDFTQASRKALGAYLDARAAEEKKKKDGGRSKVYDGAKKAYDRFLSKEPPFKLKTSEADIVKAWTDRVDEAIAESDRNAKAADKRAETMQNWQGRLESAIALGTLISVPGKPEEYKTTLDVFDGVLRELDYSRIIATRAGLTDQVAQIDHAIAYARQRRTALQYVRPASLYLRDSYPATVLQESPANSGAVPNLIWRKLTTAFVAETTTEDLAVKEQIDKQFWQTINQVRLGGGGTTNYVVAKDDLGNWYVKGYENDLTSIVNSVKGLASFAIGAKLQSSLFQPQKSSGDAAADATDAAKAERTPFGNQIDRSTDTYRKEMREVVVKAREAAGKLKETFESEYDKLQLTASGKKHLDNNRDKFIQSPSDLKIEFKVDATDDAKKDAKKLNEELRDLLDKTLEYYKKVREKLGEVVETDKKTQSRQTADEDQRTVQRAFWSLTRATIERRISESDKAASKLDSRMTLIGELLDAAVSEDSSK